MATSSGFASILRDSLQSARADCKAPQDEVRRKSSYPPAQEDILVELRPILVLANVVRPVGQIQLLHLGAGAGHIAARRIIAKLDIEPLPLLRHQEVHEQHSD